MPNGPQASRLLLPNKLSRRVTGEAPPLRTIVQARRLPSESMRLDLFLKVSRICPRRTVAQKLCDAGVVFVNDSPAKSAHSIKVGDEIEIRKRNKITRLKVLDVPLKRQTSREEARKLAEVINEREIDSFD